MSTVWLNFGPAVLRAFCPIDPFFSKAGATPSPHPQMRQAYSGAPPLSATGQAVRRSSQRARCHPRHNPREGRVVLAGGRPSTIDAETPERAFCTRQQKSPASHLGLCDGNITLGSSPNLGSSSPPPRPAVHGPQWNRGRLLERRAPGLLCEKKKPFFGRPSLSELDRIEEAENPHWPFWPACVFFSSAFAFVDCASPAFWAGGRPPFFRPAPLVAVLPNTLLVFGDAALLRGCPWARAKWGTEGLGGPTMGPLVIPRHGSPCCICLVIGPKVRGPKGPPSLESRTSRSRMSPMGDGSRVRQWQRLASIVKQARLRPAAQEKTYIPARLPGARPSRLTPISTDTRRDNWRFSRLAPANGGREEGKTFFAQRPGRVFPPRPTGAHSFRAQTRMNFVSRLRTPAGDP